MQSKKMSFKVTIDSEQCKGCRLCVAACPNGCLVISKHSNKMGYFPAKKENPGCTGCLMCAVICPDAIIEVYHDSEILAIKPNKSGKKKSTKEKV